MVQWFPGHMTKARRLIVENLKLVDVVLELADARLPVSSRNPLLDELLGEKPRLLILTKEDLASGPLTKNWLSYFTSQGIVATSFSFQKRGSQRKTILSLIRVQAQPVLAKRKAKGILNQTVRTMVVGIPNVGKSTLINYLRGKSAAETGDKPGVTKGKQWVRLKGDIELLDTPGLLWPKIEDREAALKLAASGAIGEKAYDPVDVAVWLIGWLKSNLPGSLGERYRVNEDRDSLTVLEDICRSRGFLFKGGEPEREKAAVILLDEFRAGKLGPITLDYPPLKE